jgi:hypothetical protein
MNPHPTDRSNLERRKAILRNDAQAKSDLSKSRARPRIHEFALQLLRKTFVWAREMHPSRPLTSGVWIGNWGDPATLTPTERCQLEEQNVGAYCWGFVDGKTQTIYPWDSWDKRYTAEPAPWFHDILRGDGTPYNQKEVDYIKSLTKP